MNPIRVPRNLVYTTIFNSNTSQKFENFRVRTGRDSSQMSMLQGSTQLQLLLCFRAASSRSPLFSAASPSPSLLGRRSFATSSPAFRSLPRWSHCLHSRPSPFRLSSQIRAVSPVLDRLQKNFSSMASEHPFKGIFITLPKPGGGEFGKFYSLRALNDPRIDKILLNCDNFQVTKEDVEKIIEWEKTAPKQVEIPKLICKNPDLKEK